MEPAIDRKVEPARLVEARVDPARFPDVSQGKILFAARLSEFTLSFSGGAGGVGGGGLMLALRRVRAHVLCEMSQLE